MNQRLWQLVLAALLALVGNAQADQIPGSQKTVASWYMGAYDDGKGKFSHCAMSAPYRSGITMYFSISSNYSWRVGWSHESWRFRSGQTVHLSVYVDGQGPFSLTAIARDGGVAFAELPAKGTVFDLMRKGYRMTVHAEGRTYAFNLDGTYAALTEILNCVDRYTGVAAAPRTPAAPLISRTTPQPSRSVGEVTAEQRLEATKIVANILAQGEMTGFRILSAKEIGELDNDYFKSSDVVWRAESIIGTLRIIPKSRHSGGAQISASVLADDTKACKGEFASGSLKDEKNPKVLRMFAACSDGAGRFEFRYTLVPLEDGGYYLFATAAKAGRESGKSKAVAAEALLRQAVFEVLNQ